MRRILPVLLALALAAAGCGSSSPSSGGKRAAPSTDSAKAVNAIAAHIGHRLTRKPRIPAPAGKPPSKLVERDLVRGKGAPAKPGETVVVQYVGVAWSTGKEFDSSWSRNQAFSFPLGAGQVIRGWDQGVVGMRPGGRRLLVIPPSLGYGAQGAGAAIKPNETLVFVVDLEREAGSGA
jgi:peptidylprolyl isomerase